MLDTLRANSRSVITYVLFGIIILVFVVSFGPGSRGCGASGSVPTWAAKVNGETVGVAALEQQYGQLVRFYQQQGLRDLDAPIQARLRQMAMDQAITRELIGQEARRQGIVVTDDDVSATIKSLPAFQTAGKFDLELYRRAVTSNYGSPQRFEEQVRRDLYDQKVMTLVRSSARVTEEEVKETWKSDGDRATLELARFPLAQARADLKVSDAQVAEYAAQNASKVETFFKENPARFNLEKRVHARHILVKVAPGADEKAARAKIDAVVERLKKGEDFAKVAAEVSDDPGSKKKDGDLGLFGKGVMAKPFEEAAFKLAAGQRSEPVKTAFGWHVIEVLEVKEPEQVPLEKARLEIARELLENELAKKRAGEVAAEVLAKLQAGKAFAEVLPEAGKPGEVKLGGQPVKVEETGTFTAASSPSVPRLGPAPELFADAMKGSAGEVLGKVYETAGGPVVAKVKERQRPDPARFDAQKADVEDRLRYRREAELVRAWMESLRASAKITANEAILAGAPTQGPTPLDP